VPDRYDRRGWRFALHLAGERLEHLTKRKIGFAHAAMGVTATKESEEIVMRLGCLLHKALEQGRLAAACLAHDEGQAAPALVGPCEGGAQAGQLALACHEPIDWRLACVGKRQSGGGRRSHRRRRPHRQARAKLLIQRAGGIFGLAAQLVAQQATQPLIVGQRGRSCTV